MIWRCGETLFDLSERVLVMGIVNVTPDSFSDGGVYDDMSEALARAREMLEQGADILDIGGESTRPGADPVDVDTELKRTIPIIEAIRRKLPKAVVSIDTSKAAVAREAVGVGASIINDVTAMRGDPAMLEVAAGCQAGLCLMHMQGEPRTMHLHPVYEDVVAEVLDFLAQRMREACAAGIAVERIALDPGIGFGKSFEHNLELYRRIDELRALDRPLLFGPSRKSFLGHLLDGAPVDARLEGTAAAVAAAVVGGAVIVRVHDVREMARVARVALALRPQVAAPSGESS